MFGLGSKAVKKLPEEEAVWISSWIFVDVPLEGNKDL